jgi:hypothetical protein
LPQAHVRRHIGLAYKHVRLEHGDLFLVQTDGGHIVSQGNGQVRHCFKVAGDNVNYSPFTYVRALALSATSHLVFTHRRIKQNYNQDKGA